MNQREIILTVHTRGERKAIHGEDRWLDTCMAFVMGAISSLALVLMMI